VTLAFVLLFQVAVASPRAAARSSSLTAAAQASARPRECLAATSRNAAKWGPSVWDAARDPTLDRYCDLLATGFAQLPFSPDRAIDMADRADGTSPGRAGPAILRGRAYSNKKVWDRAREEFDKARAIDARSLEDPLTMREWARALSRVGRGAEALSVYRTLGPRLSALSSADDRARTFLDAAELAFSLGPSALDDAVAFLGEAKQLAGRDLEWLVGAELALALDRKGARDEASGLVSDLARRWPKGSPPLATQDNMEAQAAIALVLEVIDARQASEAWERYVSWAGDKAPFAEHARQRALAVRKARADSPARGGKRP
jgi:tetratricopeptide (TPR) repeat protein